MPSVFLSYSSADKLFVRKLTQRLCEEGIAIWLDERQLEVGDSLIERIAEAIDKIDYVAAVISRSSIGSVWVQKELSLAMTNEIEGRRVVVLPILIEDCDLPPFLKDKLYADFRTAEASDDAFAKLLRALNRG